jgi:putative glutamine amidotransferase
MSVLPRGIPLVAVTQRVDQISNREETRDALDQRLIHWILASGGLPVPVPNFSDGDSALSEWLARILPDAIILSGGGDIGQAVHRDWVETSLLNWAEANCMPVLGLCRGMQLMGLRSGGQLVRKDKHVRTRHQLSPPRGWPGEVNSYHEWAFLDAPPSYFVLAQTDDGVIEAMRHEVLPWEGWMWHPEREHQFSPADIERWRSLMKPKGF